MQSQPVRNIGNVKIRSSSGIEIDDDVHIHPHLLQPLENNKFFHPSALFCQNLNFNLIQNCTSITSFPDTGSTSIMSQEYAGQDPLEIAKQAEADLNSTAAKHGHDANISARAGKGASDSSMPSRSSLLPSLSQISPIFLLF